MGDNWKRDINILETILKNIAKMEKSEIEALVGILILKKENNQIDNLTVTVLEKILKDNNNLSDESMEKTRDAIMAEFKSNGGAKRKKRRKTKRKKGRKSKRKRTRKRRRRSMRKRRRKKTR